MCLIKKNAFAGVVVPLSKKAVVMFMPLLSPQQTLQPHATHQIGMQLQERNLCAHRLFQGSSFPLRNYLIAICSDGVLSSTCKGKYILTFENISKR